MAAAGTPASNRKPRKNQTPEAQFNNDLNFYSKHKDLHSAISLYDSAAAAAATAHRFNHHHFNTLLYLCSISLSDPSTKDLALQHGFRIFDHMLSSGIKPNEASITAVARLAAAKGDGDYAFELVRNMGAYNVSPRLRTYDPALFCFCEKLGADKAFEVEEHMGTMGVSLEEPELAVLLKVSVQTGNEGRVYGYLQKLRRSVRCVKEETAKVIEDWFQGFEGNGVQLDVGLFREAVKRNGGGWHGLGWVGSGRWDVRRGRVDVGGRCCSCGQQLACVDIADMETERFAESVAGLAMEREVKGNFSEFQDWLHKHSDFEAVVDGANIGLYQQNFAEGCFSVSQLDAVVKELYNQSGKRWPLIVLHNKRVRALLENPSHRKLIDEWMENDALYTTPLGSNDDWYWLYASIKLRCLLVTNDEMRDHIFELLGSSFFQRWKEKHQVHYTFVKGNLKLQMPAAFSMVIQESERGSWHVPVAGDGSEESEPSWLCISRPASHTVEDHPIDLETPGNGSDICHGGGSPSSCKPENITNWNYNNSHQDRDFFENSDNKTSSVTGKRKERS